MTKSKRKKSCGDCRERVLRELELGDSRTVCRVHSDKVVYSTTDATDCKEHNKLTIIPGIKKQAWEDREKIYKGADLTEQRIYI